MKKILVTGGAGFLGFHLVNRLIQDGVESVVVADNLITGKFNNIKKVVNSGHCEFIQTDVSQPVENYLHTPVEAIYHLASPASPVGYGQHPVETYMVNGFGTHYLAEYALKHQIPILFTSTSECYGDPLEHPQTETYWGNVNPVGKRACYDESKRFGEMVISTACRDRGLDGRIVRIFNTYGPNMDPNDGRVLPNLLSQALTHQPMTVYGNGSQTRSFCYVDDLIEYIVRAMNTSAARGEVINIGNPDEFTVLEFASLVKELSGSNSEIVYKDLPSDDPTRRRPDISKAMRILDYEPKVKLREGLVKTIEWFKQV